MSVSDVQIAKLALSYIGDRFSITSLDESSTEAEQVNLVYENVRDALLAEHPWKFARSFWAPAKLAGTPPAQWSNMFSYPPNGLVVRRVVHPLGTHLPPIKFEVLRNSSDIKVLVCNEETPEFEYTQRVTNPGEFSPHFVLALSWRLAEMIAQPLTGDPEIKADMRRGAIEHVQVAKTQDSNENVGDGQNADPDWITARG